MPNPPGMLRNSWPADAIHTTPSSPSLSLQIQTSFDVFRRQLRDDQCADLQTHLLEVQDLIKVNLQQLREYLSIQDGDGMQPWRNFNEKTATTAASENLLGPTEAVSPNGLKPQLVTAASDVRLLPSLSPETRLVSPGSSISVDDNEVTARPEWIKALQRRATAGYLGPCRVCSKGDLAKGASFDSDCAIETSMNTLANSSSNSQGASSFAGQRSVTVHQTISNAVKPALNRLASTGNMTRMSGVARPARMFGNFDRTINMGRRTIHEDIYDVASLYSQTGIFQKIARSGFFNSCTLCMICLNTVYLGVASDLNPDASVWKAQLPFQLCEHAFCVFFSLELLVRLFAFANKWQCFSDFWFFADLLLVLHLILDTYVLATFISTDGLRSIRIFRLLRLLRFSRLMRASPELMTMIKAMVAGTRAATSAFIMLLLLNYVFAIALHSQVRDEPEVAEYFATIGDCMYTLTLDALFMDGIGDLTRKLREIEAWSSIFILGVFVLISVFLVLNILLGIFCEVVTKVSEGEAENNARFQMRETLLVLMRRLDVDNSGSITKQELYDVVADEEAVAVLDSLQVDMDYLFKMLDMLYTEIGYDLPIIFLLDMILKQRGERPCNMEDLAASTHLTRWTFEQLLNKQSKDIKDYIASQQSLKSSVFTSLKSAAYMEANSPQA